jgi:hypothetical protein
VEDGMKPLKVHSVWPISCMVFFITTACPHRQDHRFSCPHPIGMTGWDRRFGLRIVCVDQSLIAALLPPTLTLGDCA